MTASRRVGRPARLWPALLLLATAWAACSPPTQPAGEVQDTIPPPTASATSRIAERVGADGTPPAPPLAATPPMPTPSALLPSPAAPEAAAAVPRTDADLSQPSARACPPLQPGPGAAPRRSRQAPPPTIGAAAAAVIDAGSGVVLWGVNEHTPLQPASVTKIVTALLAVERGNLDEVIHVNVEDRRFNVGTRMGLVQGDQFTLRDLLYGLMLPSGNDAAIVIAQHLAGDEAAFAGQMTRRMCELGLGDSAFINSSGLGRGEYNLTSAYDLAQVTRHAMELPAFAQIARARIWTARGSRTLSFRNLNEIVHSYPDADGVKIGWTPSAGHTIVASATRNGHRVIVALLRTPNRAAESAALLDWAFSSHTWTP